MGNTGYRINQLYPAVLSVAFRSSYIESQYEDTQDSRESTFCNSMPAWIDCAYFLLNRILWRMIGGILVPGYFMIFPNDSDMACDVFIRSSSLCDIERKPTSYPDGDR